jgi:hypothetical protein
MIVIFIITCFAATTKNQINRGYYLRCNKIVKKKTYTNINSDLSISSRIIRVHRNDCPSSHNGSLRVLKS